MKKIALLFTIMSIGALNAMEVPEGKIFGKKNGIPMDLKKIIISLLDNFRDAKDAVKAIEGLSLTNKQLSNLINAKYGKFYNMQGFTTLVHKLADKYNITTKDVALLFNAPIAKEYLDLASDLKEALEGVSSQKGVDTQTLIEYVSNLIEQGADVNNSSNTIFKGIDSEFGSIIIETPLIIAMKAGSIYLVKLLINAGAKVESDEYYNDNKVVIFGSIKRATIEHLLNEAREKQQN